MAADPIVLNPAGDPARSPALAPPAPPLRVVDPMLRARERRLRFTLFVAGALAVFAVFGAAAFHVVLAQSQLQLDTLNTRVAAEQQRYERARLDVAHAAAPDRVVQAAQQRLGMVVPDQVTYLSAPADPNGGAGTEARGWSEVKPSLAAQP